MNNAKHKEPVLNHRIACDKGCCNVDHPYDRFFQFEYNFSSPDKAPHSIRLGSSCSL